MSLGQKLKIKTDQSLWLLEATKELKQLFGDCIIKTSFTGKEQAGQLILFAKDKKQLDKFFPGLVKKLAPRALFWIAHPKKSGSIQSDLIRDEGWEIVWKSDYEGVASAYINEDWSGMRFRHKNEVKNLKREAPIAERKIEGIDFINRIVTLPDDARKMMKPYVGLEDFFNTLAFTHKKEHVEAIAQAKKPETRERRIQKMIDLLLKHQEERSKNQKAKPKKQ